MLDDFDIENDRVVIPIIVSNHEYLELRKGLYKITQKYSRDRNKTWDEIKQTPRDRKEDEIKSLFHKTLYLTAQDISNELRNSRKQWTRLPYTNFSLIDPDVVHEARDFINKEEGRRND